MLSAAEILRELDVPLSGDILFATVVDEEIGGMGTWQWRIAAIEQTQGF